MNYLDEIITHKRKEVEETKSLYPVKLLEQSIYFNTKPVSLKNYLLKKNLSGIIAEFKRKSPSKGMINQYASVERTTIGYAGVLLFSRTPINISAASLIVSPPKSSFACFALNPISSGRKTCSPSFE